MKSVTLSNIALVKPKNIKKKVDLRTILQRNKVIVICDGKKYQKRQCYRKLS
jgi:hypothetical protein